MPTSFEQHFIAKYSVLGIILGGSTVYSEITTHDSRDWDGIIIVAERSDILNMVAEAEPLKKYLALTSEEYPDSPMSASLHHDFDGVRFSGVDHAGVKKSVKILAMDHLLRSDHVQNSIRILSRKDVRTYRGFHYGYISWKINPAQTLDADTYLLHDADIFMTSTSYSTTSCRRAAFGACADLIITGQWLYLSENADTTLISHLLRRFANVPNVVRPADPALLFTKGSRFSANYRDKLLAKPWAHILNNIPIEENNFGDVLLLWNFVAGQATRTIQATSNRPSLITQHDVDATFSLVSTSETPFSSNSTSGFCKRIMSSGSDAIFWKRPADIDNELKGAALAQPFVQVLPVIHVDRVEGIVYYPWFEGSSLASLRLAHHLGTADHSKILLEVEMRRAEDILSIYCGTLRQGPADSSIQQFFQDRVHSHRRLRQLYSHGLTLGHTTYALDELLYLPLVINNEAYTSLDSLLENAHDTLANDGLIALGLGDGHSGNVMVSSPSLPSKHIYVDFETVGWHSPWLDMAKPSYNDALFEVLYADLLGRDLIAEGVMQVDISDNIRVELDLNKAISPLARSILEIKKTMIMHPLEDVFRTMPNMEATICAGRLTFANALVCCAILTRNFSSCAELLFANLAAALLIGRDVL
jgi:hypothetical protein